MTRSCLNFLAGRKLIRTARADSNRRNARRSTGPKSAAGKAKAAACAACHGANGQGVPPNPALVGKSEDDMLQAMKDYKSGKRANAVMKGMTAGLNDQDMANLAAYYASLKK